ncbi:hypothetical protein PR048_000938, partial [Dryococelus australis]
MKVKLGECGAALECMGGESVDPRENPLTSGIIQHDSQMQESGGDPAGIRTRPAILISVFHGLPRSLQASVRTVPCDRHWTVPSSVSAPLSNFALYLRTSLSTRHQAPPAYRCSPSYFSLNVSRPALKATHSCLVMSVLRSLRKRRRHQLTMPGLEDKDVCLSQRSSASVMVAGDKDVVSWSFGHAVGDDVICEIRQRAPQLFLLLEIKIDFVLGTKNKPGRGHVTMFPCHWIHYRRFSKDNNFRSDTTSPQANVPSPVSSIYLAARFLSPKAELSGQPATGGESRAVSFHLHSRAVCAGTSKQPRHSSVSAYQAGCRRDVNTRTSARAHSCVDGCVRDPANTVQRGNCACTTRMFSAGASQDQLTRVHAYAGAAVVLVVRLTVSHKCEPGSIPCGAAPDFRMWESCRTMPLVGGFSRGSPVPPVLAFLCCSIPHIILIGYQDPNPSTHSTASVLLVERERRRSGKLSTYNRRDLGSIPGPAILVSVVYGFLQLLQVNAGVRHDGNTARLARRSDETLEVRASVARIAPSLVGLGRARAVGIIPDYAASRRVFSGISRPPPFIPALRHTNLTSPSSALKTSIVRAIHISSLTST